MFPASFTVGVGNNPDTVSLVGRAKVPSRYAVPFRIIPDLGQVSENVAKPSTKQLCAVFQEDVSWLQLANEAESFGPEAASRVRKPKAFSGNADALAREAPGDDIDGNSIGSESCAGKGANIVIAGDSGPMFRQNAAGEGFDFAKGYGFKAARPLKAKAEAADAGKQVKDAQLHSRPQGETYSPASMSATTAR